MKVMTPKLLQTPMVVCHDTQAAFNAALELPASYHAEILGAWHELSADLYRRLVAKFEN
jgi:hypothetical protein